MPRSLAVIEKAADQLEKACQEMKGDPYSQNGRDRLIQGSRGILQGTTSMLVTFDESQVRKLCRDCKKVLDYLAISEVIETMEDLVQFVKDLSPCLSKVSHDVEARRKDLLNPYHRDLLGQHLEQVKTLAPILICSMKIFIQILGTDAHGANKGMEEAVENRNYLAKRMTEEIAEIMSILEDSAKADDVRLNLKEMTFHEIVKKMNQLLGSGGGGKNNAALVEQQLNQRSIQFLVDLAFKITEGFDGHVKSELLQKCNQLDTINRQCGNNFSSDHNSRQQLSEALRNLEIQINEAIISRIIQDMADVGTPLKQFADAVTINHNDNLMKKREVLESKGQNLKLFSHRLSKTANMVASANARSKRSSENLIHLSSQVQNLTPQLINAGTIRMNYPDNKAADENFENLRKQYAEGVHSIRDLCDESMETRAFLRQTEEHIRRAVAASEEGLRSKQTQIMVDNTALAARLSNRLLMALYKESDNSDDPALRKQVDASGDRLKSAITPFVENGRAVASSPNDQGLITAWRMSANKLLEIVEEVARLFAELNMYGYDSLNNGRQATTPAGSSSGIARQEAPPPPRPPLPEEVRGPPPRPPMPNANTNDTDDEEGLFTNEPGTNRPIHVAAHGLYQEVKQWDHSDNEIIAAAKKIAYLMAHLSELIRGGKGTKRELIACAKALADASERITELAKELARNCTDKKIRTNLLQVCEKIPTLGTQLRVLSTVKATMMGQNMDTEEDQEAMDMLVFNAQKLNEAVKETVRAAESASIRVRSDAGFKLKWVRKPAWFQ
eukprot:10886.XXX_123334_120703_1 [CDS] Oithona nana genome sequencing.